jgi:hypothetical protein
MAIKFEMGLLVGKSAFVVEAHNPAKASDISRKDRRKRSPGTLPVHVASEGP